MGNIGRNFLVTNSYRRNRNREQKRWIDLTAVKIYIVERMDGVDMSKILIACEWSGIVRDAFRKNGFDAWSCDLIPTESTYECGYHLEGDVLWWLYGTNAYKWDLMIAFPPCTYLAVSGARWFKDRQAEQKQALNFVQQLLNAPVKHIALENPIGVISTHIRKPDQIIQPWMFGHGEIKSTCLWLKNLPKLKPTKIVNGRKPRIHYMGPSKNRGKLRGKTYDGIAEAMAKQWGEYLRKDGWS